jgi:DNA-binding response OmpR family regulator
MNRILLVEDDELVGTMVRLNLESDGYHVVWCRDGSTGLATGLAEPFDLLLLDISLPGESGLDVLKSLREAEIGTPVMMLTARSDVSSKVRALNLGADDYLPKPFDVTEMTARVRALLRRAQAEREHHSSRIIMVGECRVDMSSRHAETSKGTVVLSDKEVAILSLLVCANGAVLSRADIIEEVWGLDQYPHERTVDNYMVRLRKLLEPDPSVPKHLLTIRGAGFRFHP